jgi:hypothetical protein
VETVENLVLACMIWIIRVECAVDNTGKIRRFSTVIHAEGIAKALFGILFSVGKGKSCRSVPGEATILPARWKIRAKNGAFPTLSSR